ncbi:hypothetical protein ES703_75354 [subsurface metagenome]
MVGKGNLVAVNSNGLKSKGNHRWLGSIDIPDMSDVVCHARQLGDDFYGAVTDITTSGEGDYYRLLDRAAIRHIRRLGQLDRAGVGISLGGESPSPVPIAGLYAYCG